MLRQRKRGDREEWSGEEDEWARGAGRGAESCAVGQEGRQGEGGKLRGGAGRGRKVARWGRKEQQGEGSGGANNACNFWGRVVRESPVLYDFVYYKAIFMEL